MPEGPLPLKALQGSQRGRHGRREWCRAIGLRCNTAKLEAIVADLEIELMTLDEQVERDKAAAQVKDACMAAFVAADEALAGWLTVLDARDLVLHLSKAITRGILNPAHHS